MPTRIGERIATALQTDNTITPAEAKSIIDTAKAERKWTPELKAEVNALLANGTAKFSGTAKGDLQAFLSATPTQKDLADPKVLAADATKIAWNPMPGGQLYVDGVNFDDVAQGYIGDCYIEGAMAAVAQTHPEAIKDALKDNGDGTFTVRFFEPQAFGRAPKPVSITVDGDLPSKTVASQPYYAHGRDFKELWPALIEKAYAQWKGSYDAIGNGGNPGVVMTALTGKPSSSTSNASLKPDVLFERIRSQAAGAHPITASTFGEDREALYTNTGVHANHVYTVLGASVENGVKYVQLRNPWGFSEPANNGKDDGIFKLPLTDFVKLYSSTSFNG